MKKVLVLGKTGYIGTQFINELKYRNLSYRAISRVDIDYCDYSHLYTLLTTDCYRAFDLVINCAGYVGKPNVDVCEKNKEETIKGNIVLPKMISDICSDLSINFMHISSGCIYTGYDKQYTEEDIPNFCFDSEIKGSFYSGTKALAEDLINKNNSYVCRLRIPFDEFDSPRNYISKLINYDKLLDMENSISHRGDFVKACLDLYEKNCPKGIYNVTNTGSVTTRWVAEKMKEFNIKCNFDFFDNEQTFYKFGAKAPRSNCLLDNSKLTSAGVKIRTVEEALEDSLIKWKK